MTSLLAEHTSARVGSQVHRATLVVPVGAIEQHGPHLPVHVDSLVVERVARDAARRVGDRSGRPILVAPTVSFGSSHHHLPRAGTLSLRSATLQALLADLLDSAVAGGFRSLVLLNGHGGNQDIVHQAVRDLAIRHDVTAAATSYWTPAWEALIATATAHGIGPVPGHAGSFETSLVLHLEPALVDHAALPDGPTIDEWQTRHPLSLPVVERHGWVHQMGGFTDGAGKASAAAGQALFYDIVEGVSAFLEQCRGHVASTEPHQGGVR